MLLEPGYPSEAMPAAGDPMVVEIDLPANHGFGRKCMQCHTTVVRVTAGEGEPPRIAMRIHKMRFQSLDESAPFEDRPGDLVRQLLM